MTDVDRLWAGWRSAYVERTNAPKPNVCVFCGLLASDAPAEETNIVWRNELVAAVLNAYPYGTGHILVMPVRHIGRLDNLTSDESATMWRVVNDASRALEKAYRPDGMNIGFNLGDGSGAGIPEHLHAHALPRWKADTNFITSVANARVLPEALGATWKKLSEAWPTD